jgi:N,N'-diacetyllegionaminate synthase
MSSQSLRRLRPQQPPEDGCLIIAEVAQAHDGSLGLAHAFIDAAARSGVDAIKFQTHIAAAESTPDEPWRVQFSTQDATRYDYWRRMEFTEEQWHELAEHATKAGLLFISSPFSAAAVELLERVGMPIWKIASGEVTNLRLIDQVASTGRPVLLSSGMSRWGELDDAVAAVRRHHDDVVVLQCATRYPCPPEQVGLNVLGELAERYGCAVGLSDHSATIFPSLAAVTLGASVIEVHLTLSRDMFGPDVSSSLTTDELAELVRGVRFVEAMLEHPVDKDDVAGELQPVRDLFTRSVVLTRDVAAGRSLTADDLIAKKPGTGIPEAKLADLVGRRTRVALAADSLLAESDLEPSP